ncbi:UDP-N-acetylglucosamine 1-carboxyvinyltransferase [Hymenobacter rubripertinctus]|uniref:UDP-N-acetylglucosamine 1-carboxyvinyltransferase n=1 Tax=Hymenobacter rubripertinctus TaxID=2029981 RepID=A0A418R727_9BACT|nr:UDP-N-acetylglucosamine 1-carboxyvinyltransferase [Hymenobacter rubripertinctus]RIY13318.1 UDP-N-acetylglucosamine 1-carboxyvinyltransferase [Hymenobacter rubripertinctus]
MASFEVIGGKPLHGEIVPQGAKNEALQILCAVLLTAEPVTISNIPDIRDVNKLIELLRDMGVKVGKLASDTYRFQADSVNLDYLDTPEFVAQAGALRGSVMILGPMLARFGRCQLPKPGGDKIGRRPMDTHFLGLEKLGGKLTLEGKDFYRIRAENGLSGAYMMLDEASVTGTANIVMAAVLAQGTTTIYNAACEPYLQQLCKMLVRMGAKINGIGSNLLTVEGVEQLGGTDHRMLPDMIEIGSFIGLAAMTGSEITIKDCQIAELGLIPDTFRKLGIKLEFQGDDIHIPAQQHYEIDTYLDGSILTISDHTWPGFTPDLLSIVLVVATQAKGTVLIHQKMFESRLFFVDKLIDMGAQVILCDPHRATVIGLNHQKRLHGITMTSPDIRAGVALLIAALSAEGRSVIENVEQIDRGYQHIDKRLTALGAQIRRL